MSDEAVAGRLLAIAQNCSRNETQEENFSTLLASTRQQFRRGTRTPTRGRRRNRTFRRPVCVLKLAHADFYPSSGELLFLREMGLGLAVEQLTVDRDDPIDVIKEDIISLFGSNIQTLLRMCGFKIAKVERSKRIIGLNDLTNGKDLEVALKQSKIVILPNNDFPANLPTIESRPLQSRRSATTNSHLASTSGGVAERSTSTFQTRRSSSLQTEQTTEQRSSIFERPTSTFRTRRSSSLQTDQHTEQESSIFELTSSEDEDQSQQSMGNPEVHENVEPLMGFPTLPTNAVKIKVQLSRANCLHDVLNLYSDESNLDFDLEVSFKDELGVDGGGLTKELFNLFFKHCENTYFKGEECLVPHLELAKNDQIDNFICIGRALQHMVVLTNTIPSKLSRVTLMLLANPDKPINDDNILLRDLLNFVNPYLRKILKKAQNNFDTMSENEKDIIADFFHTFSFNVRPNKNTFNDQLRTLAVEILIDQPNRKLIPKIRQGLCPEKHSVFWANCDFNCLLDLQTPTHAKVINCLSTDTHLNNEETSVLHFFTMFINCISKSELSTLVYLVTGSFLMPPTINVQFNDSVGLMQMPTFSTCTDTITLPRTYATYDDLKHDLNACIHSEEAMEFTAY